MMVKFSTVLALSFGLAAQPAAAQTADVSAQAAFAVRSLRQAGMDAVIVLDKNRGELLVVEDGRLIMKSSALYGKGRGEDEKKDFDTTPAGVFSLKEYSVSQAEYDGGRAFGFLDTAKRSYVIHAVWNGEPSEKRNQRLASVSPDDNAISSGCINVPYGFYVQLSHWLKTHPQYRDGASKPGYASLVILPKNDDLQITARYLGLPRQTAQVLPQP